VVSDDRPRSGKLITSLRERHPGRAVATAEQPRPARLITSLRERRAIEEALAHMLTVRTGQQWNRQARHIAGLGPEVLHVLTQRLSTADTFELAALGTIATYMDATQVTQVLYDLITRPGTPDVQRMGAILILERYLGQAVPETAFLSLQDARGVARQSLAQILAAARQNRLLLLEYMHILLEQPAEATQAVIEAVVEMGGEDGIPLLRLLAQDEEPAIAGQALQALETLPNAAALQTLQSVLPVLPPPLRERAERTLRKRRFRGQEVPPLPSVPPSCRALVSPIDGRGNQLLWFLQRDPTTRCLRFLGLLVSDVIGLQDALGDDAVLPGRFPRRREHGTLHVIQNDDQPLLMLEAPYDYARRLLLQRLKINQALELAPPLEYRLLNDLIWGYALPEEWPSRRPTIAPAYQRTLIPRLPSLLDHPAMQNWFIEGESVYTCVERLTRWRHIDVHDPTVQRWLMNLVTEYFTPEDLARYQARLLDMSEWFMWSGEEETAHLAWIASATLPHVPPQQHPLVVGMIERGLQVAALNLQQGFDLRQARPATES